MATTVFSEKHCRCILGLSGGRRGDTNARLRPGIPDIVAVTDSSSHVDSAGVFSGKVHDRTLGYGGVWDDDLAIVEIGKGRREDPDLFFTVPNGLRTF